MAQHSRVNWRGAEVLLKVKEFEGLALDAIAHQIEAEAKANIVSNDQVDTGFMLNAVYVVTAEASGYGAARSAARGRNSGGEMGPEVSAPEDGAAVVAGANYSIFQEQAKPFLFPAAQRVAGQIGGELERIGRDVFND